MTLSELQSLEREWAIPTYVRNPVEFVRGQGVSLWDSDGNEYLDFLAGISVLNVGHCHPRVVAAIQAQAATLTHVSNLYYTEQAFRLSQRWRRARSAARCSCATQAPRPTRRRSSWLAATDRAARSWFCATHFTDAPMGRCRRRRRRPSRRRSRRWCPGSSSARRIRRAVDAAVGPRTAAVLLEPIQGESGVLPLSEEFLAAARERLRSRGCGVDLRRGPDRNGADRVAVGLPADRCRPRCADERQGAGRGCRSARW